MESFQSVEPDFSSLESQVAEKTWSFDYKFECLSKPFTKNQTNGFQGQAWFAFLHSLFCLRMLVSLSWALGLAIAHARIPLLSFPLSWLTFNDYSMTKK
jgi:hypothetical protein